MTSSLTLDIVPDANGVNLVEKDTEKRLRRLAIKWISQARHPIRNNRPEERDLLIKCAAELQEELHAGPHRSCCGTRPGESHTGICEKSVMRSGEWND